MERRSIIDHPGFTVDKNGNVFDKNGNARVTYRNGDGYVGVSIKRKDGCWITYGVHRLVALAFLDDTHKKGESEVNHRFPDLDNNSVMNLEWVTPSQNNIHSEIMRKDNIRTTLYSNYDGMPKGVYLNAWEAAGITGCTVLEIWDSVKNNEEVRKWKFFYRSFTNRLPSELRLARPRELGYKASPLPKKIKMLDIHNGEILHFVSISKAAEHFGVYNSHIVQNLARSSRPRVFLKRYQVAYFENDFLPMTNDERLRALGHGPKAVVAYKVTEKAYVRYESAKDFILQNLLSKKSFTKDLAKGRMRLNNGWIAIYYSPENFESLKAFVAGLAAMID